MKYGNIYLAIDGENVIVFTDEAMKNKTAVVGFDGEVVEGDLSFRGFRYPHQTAELVRAAHFGNKYGFSKTPTIEDNAEHDGVYYEGVMYTEYPFIVYRYKNSAVVCNCKESYMEEVRLKEFSMEDWDY